MYIKVIALGLSILAMALTMSSPVEAYPGTISGTSTTQCICFNALNQRITCPSTCSLPSCKKVCSIDVASILSGLGNTTPNDTSNAAYAVNLFIEHATIFCVNKPGNAEPAQGQAFINEPVEVEHTDLIEPASITKNGRALSEITFTDQDLLDALITAGALAGASCPNSNWQIRVFVDAMEVFGRLFRDEDGALAGGCDLTNPASPPCVLADALSQQCNAPSNASVNQPFDYNCNTLCHNADNKFAECPVIPQVITDPTP
ncbi:MAG TPA: hypothetical protein VFV05_11420 [Methylomirabilota bacterium]|nr:hypothetical protein [Methylomirabilota bacterium]